MDYSKRVGRLPTYPMAELPAIKRRLIQQGVDVIDVGAGDADFPPPRVAVETLARAIQDPAMSRYAFQLGLPAFREAAAGYMKRRFGLGPQSLVVEVASNDGYLLQYFRELGVPVLGIEPAANVAESAIARGIPNSNPINTRLKAPRMTRRTTVGRPAPSAMRIPISLVRRATAYAVTPYNPIAASSRATLPNKPARLATARS